MQQSFFQKVVFEPPLRGEAMYDSVLDPDPEITGRIGGVGGGEVIQTLI